jgi:hypothetical protein
VSKFIVLRIPDGLNERVEILSRSRGYTIQEYLLQALDRLLDSADADGNGSLIERLIEKGIVIEGKMVDDPTPFSDLEAYGMWADREDMSSSILWVNRRRRAWESKHHSTRKAR